MNKRDPDEMTSAEQVQAFLSQAEDVDKEARDRRRLVQFLKETGLAMNRQTTRWEEISQVFPIYVQPYGYWKLKLLHYLKLGRLPKPLAETMLDTAASVEGPSAVLVKCELGLCLVGPLVACFPERLKRIIIMNDPDLDTAVAIYRVKDYVEAFGNGA